MKGQRCLAESSFMCGEGLTSTLHHPLITVAVDSDHHPMLLPFTGWGSLRTGA